MKNLIKFSFIITSFLFANCGEPQTSEDFAKEITDIVVEADEVFWDFYIYYDKKGTREMEDYLNKLGNVFTEDKLTEQKYDVSRDAIKYYLKSELEDSLRVFNGGDKLYEVAENIIATYIKIKGNSVTEAIDNFNLMSDEELNNLININDEFYTELYLFYEKNGVLREFDNSNLSTEQKKTIFPTISKHKDCKFNSSTDFTIQDFNKDGVNDFAILIYAPVWVTIDSQNDGGTLKSFLFWFEGNSSGEYSNAKLIDKDFVWSSTEKYNTDNSTWLSGEQGRIFLESGDGYRDNCYVWNSYSNKLVKGDCYD